MEYVTLRNGVKMPLGSLELSSFAYHAAGHCGAIPGLRMGFALGRSHLIHREAFDNVPGG